MISGSPHPALTAEGSRGFRRVLAATPLDESGTRAVLRAARLPLAPGARVAVLHATPPWAMRSRRVSPRDAPALLERTVAEGRAAARSVGNEDVQLVPMHAAGWPAAEIVRFAWQERSEVIVVGPPATRIDGSTRATLARVMCRADLPILVARTDPAREYRHVLCAVDRSVTAVDTVALAARLASRPTRAFTLFHGYRIAFEPWLGADAPVLEREAVEYVQALARDVADEVAVTRTVVARGDPALRILHAAVEQRADLVVLGTRGRSGIARALLGSAAEWLIANAPFDVAVARPHRVTLRRR